jgi:ZIP family zinc transporter
MSAATVVCKEEESAEVINLDNTAVAFGLVFAAGLSTAVGAALVFFKNLVSLANKRVLAAGLGFSSGVMIYVSFVEIFVKSSGAFEANGYSEKDAYMLATLCFFSGMLILRLLSFLVHKLDQHHGHSCDSAEKTGQAPAANDAPTEPANPSVATSDRPTSEIDELKTENAQLKDKLAQLGWQQAETNANTTDKRLEKMGLKTAAAIAIHNFPEGLATFVATLADAKVGATLAIAIAVHNVPEGLCVALPIYYSSGSKIKGFIWALLSGLSEPIGAFIGWIIIKSTGDDLNQAVYGSLFGIVGGMMVMIVLLELLPTACRYDPNDTVVTNGVACGMLVMAASLCLFMA